MSTAARPAPAGKGAAERAPMPRRIEGMSHTETYLREAAQIAATLDAHAIEALVDLIAEVRSSGGRLFVLGSGGGAAHASHAVCDFRKLAGVEAYSPSDNVGELTARINDEGWDTAYAAWLTGSRIRQGDLVLVFSVGGGDRERNISPNLVAALDVARAAGARIAGIVGRDGGYTARIADAWVIVPTVNPSNVTAHTESFQAVIWHLLVMHPKLQRAPMKWESQEPSGP
jgi:D-sedoheptulose 7-phosphate isomerase